MIVSLRPRLDRGHGIAQPQIDPLPAQLLVDRGDHLGIHRRHHLVAQLQQRDVDRASAEVFDHLQSDVAAADDHRPIHFAVGKPPVNPIDVVEVAEREDAGQIDSRQRRPHRLGPGGQHQHVVRLMADGARLEVLHLDGAVLPVDAADFVPGANLDVEQIAEPLGRGHQQMAPVGDHPADVVRQSAVGERDVAAPLEDEDFGRFIHAAEPAAHEAPPATPPTIRTRLDMAVAELVWIEARDNAVHRPCSGRACTAVFAAISHTAAMSAALSGTVSLMLRLLRRPDSRAFYRPPCTPERAHAPLTNPFWQGTMGLPRTFREPIRMSATTCVPDAAGRFGPFGGRYVPETLTHALEELAAEYEKAVADPKFHEELAELYRHYVGRPSPLVLRRAAERALRRGPHLPETRRPQPYRRP